ncbi:hypothetical protein KY319_01290 [Candidatus Woesearchaeota archaeon]|nr:hypothetical protein [Candidatus Woesearchaeota archaeon]
MVSEEELNELVRQMVQAGRDKDYERFHELNVIFSGKETAFCEETGLPPFRTNKWDKARNQVINYFGELQNGRDSPHYLDEALRLIE